MTINEILILIYCLIGLGVGIGWFNSSTMDIKTDFKWTVALLACFIGLIWPVSISAGLSKKLFE